MMLEAKCFAVSVIIQSFFCLYLIFFKDILEYLVWCLKSFPDIFELKRF